MQSHCDSESCCDHQPENLRYLTRDGVTKVHCTQCHSESDAPDVTILGTIVPTTGTPCADEYPHQWGGPI